MEFLKKIKPQTLIDLCLKCPFKDKSQIMWRSKQNSCPPQICVRKNVSKYSQFQQLTLTVHSIEMKNGHHKNVQ